MKKTLENALKKRNIPYEFADENPPYFMVRDGVNKPILIDLDAAEESYHFYWAYSHQTYPLGAESEIAQVVGDILDGRLLSFAVFVGEDAELAGFCEKEFLPTIMSDCADDPMMTGGEVRLSKFGSGVIETLLLSEAL